MHASTFETLALISASPAAGATHPSGGAGAAPAGGFTLVELMVTLAMSAILMTFAVPGFNELIKSNRLSSTANDLLSTLQYARSEAVTRKTAVTVCTSADSVSADDPSCDSTVNWQNGWIVFVDRNGNNARTTGAGSTETLLAAREPVGAAGLTLVGSTDVAHAVRFVSDGTASGSGTIRLCDDRGAGKGKTVTIERYTGRTFAATGASSCP